MQIEYLTMAVKWNYFLKVIMLVATSQSCSWVFSGKNLQWPLETRHTLQNTHKKETHCKSQNEANGKHVKRKMWWVCFVICRVFPFYLYMLCLYSVQFYFNYKAFCCFKCMCRTLALKLAHAQKCPQTQAGIHSHIYIHGVTHSC